MRLPLGTTIARMGMVLFMLVATFLPTSLKAQVEQTFKYTELVSDEVNPELLWLGTEGGVKSYHQKKREWQLYPLVPPVNCFFVDVRDKNLVWAGTKSGLFVFSRDTNEWRPANQQFPKLKSDKATSAAFLSGDITAIIADPIKPKMLFLATDDGLAHFDLETQKADFLTVDDGLVEDRITCMELDRELPARLWLGAAGGLMSVDVATLQIRRHLSLGEVPGDEIRTIAVNSEWVLVNNPQTGIAGYHKEGDYWDYYRPYEKVALSDYYVLSLLYSVHEESVKLWIGTRSYGVLAFDETTKMSVQLLEKGLSVTAFAASIKDPEQLYFTAQVCAGGGVGYYSFADRSWWSTSPMVVLDATFPVSWREIQKDSQGF